MRNCCRGKAPLLISRIHRSPQHSLRFFPTWCVLKCRSLVTSSHSVDSPPSRAHVVTVRRMSCNWTLVDSQLNYSNICSQSPLQSSTQLPTVTEHYCSQTNCFSSLYSTKMPSADNVSPPNWPWGRARSTPTIPLVVMGGCLATARIFLMCFPAATKQRMLFLAIVV
jgi:hypothetical protein